VVCLKAAPTPSHSPELQKQEEEEQKAFYRSSLVKTSKTPVGKRREKSAGKGVTKKIKQQFRASL
jgi:hypothetical protein